VDKFPRQEYDHKKRPMIGDKKGSITNTTGKSFGFQEVWRKNTAQIF